MIRKACSTKNRVKNTGKECDTSMGATAMLIALVGGTKFTEADMVDPVDWVEGLIHDRIAFPLFGMKAPIRRLTNNSEADVMITLDDGLQIFVRHGIYNRVLETTSGGLCYAKALQSFLNSGYDLLEIDGQGQMLARKNDDGTFSGFNTDFMYSPSPTLADLKTTVFMNRFSVSYSPVEIVNNGFIFEGAEALLNKMGLIDSDVFQAAPATVTKLIVGVRTECAETDLIALLGAPLADPDNFVVTNEATGAVISITGAAIVGGRIELTGTFVVGQKYRVRGSNPSIWYDNTIEGYDASETGSEGVVITIPA